VLNFYGRRCPRKLDYNQLGILKKSNFFFSNSNIKNLKKSLKGWQEINLEIGFGVGENLLFQSVKNEKEFFVGCDPFIKGSINLYKKIQRFELKNLFLSNLDFQEFSRFIDLVYFKHITILFPDPWPKKKHKKRRLINSKFPELINKYSNEKTKIIVSTDDEDYLNQILYVFYKSSLFSLSTNITGKNIFKKFSIQPTKYYKKALLNNRKIYHLIFEKKKS